MCAVRVSSKISRFKLAARASANDAKVNLVDTRVNDSMNPGSVIQNVLQARASQICLWPEVCEGSKRAAASRHGHLAFSACETRDINCHQRATVHEAAASPGDSRPVWPVCSPSFLNSAGLATACMSKQAYAFKWIHKRGVQVARVLQDNATDIWAGLLP